MRDDKKKGAQKKSLSTEYLKKRNLSIFKSPKIPNRLAK